MEEERSTGVVIRTAVEADLPRIEHLLAAGKLLSAGNITHAEGSVVAEVGAELAGVVGLKMFGSDGLLRATSVGVEGRGRDVGRLLVEAILTEGALQAADAIFLFTDGSDRFFARFGFVVLTREEVPTSMRHWAETNGGVSQSAMPMRLTLMEG
jgi:N-acetylglutamate synthase-like GNAT family acetyltransferase